MSLEILDLSFVFEGSFACWKRAKVSPFSCFWVDGARVNAIHACLEFAYHCRSPSLSIV